VCTTLVTAAVSIASSPDHCIWPRRWPARPRESEEALHRCGRLSVSAQCSVRSSRTFRSGFAADTLQRAHNRVRTARVPRARRGAQKAESTYRVRLSRATDLDRMTLRSVARVALVLALAVPLTNANALEYVCEMDGQVHRSCCCENEAAGTPGCVQLGSRGCCEIRPVSEDPSTRPERAQVGDQAPVMTPVLTVVEAVQWHDSRPPRDTCVYAATGPPTFLRNCSILR